MTSIRIACAALFAAATLSPAVAGERTTFSVEPHALMHYSYCISSAKDRSTIYDLDRQVLYRCHGDIAVSYFNYLGHLHVRDIWKDEPTGTFIYRVIAGIGKCWNMVADVEGRPMSVYGCDVYVEI
jgi:hypothetical protein